MKYWFNVKTNAVEMEESRSPSSELLGPFPTYGEATLALAKAEERTRQSDASDAAWHDTGSETPRQTN
jgi:hypothetical protein